MSAKPGHTTNRQTPAVAEETGPGRARLLKCDAHALRGVSSGRFSSASSLTQDSGRDAYYACVNSYFFFFFFFNPLYSPSPKS